MLTTTQLLAQLLLDEPLPQYLDRKRSEGMSWRKIALDLRDRTNGQIDVTAQTLMTWARAAA